MIARSEPISLAPAPRDAGRLMLLDLARLVAAIGVIAAHVIDEFFPGNPAWILGSYAVPFYLFVALYFTVRGFATRPDRAVGMYALGRVKKLYVPFIVWNILYDVLHQVHHPGASITPPTEITWAAVYTHLYFLPFLLLVTLMLCAAIRPLLRSALLRYSASALLISTAIIVACLPQPTWLADPHNIAHETLWNFHRAVPAACLAVCFALIAGTRAGPLRTRRAVAVAGLVLAVTSLAIEYRFGQQALLRAASGFGLMLVAFLPVRAEWLKPFAALGRLSFGVYLSHVAVIRVVMAIVDREGLPHDARVATCVGLCALAGGLLISKALSWSKWCRLMIGCEEPERTRPREVDSALLNSLPQAAI